VTYVAQFLGVLLVAELSAIVLVLAFLPGVAPLDFTEVAS
jgi:hypothetical protein